MVIPKRKIEQLCRFSAWNLGWSLWRGVAVRTCFLLRSHYAHSSKTWAAPRKRTELKPIYRHIYICTYCIRICIYKIMPCMKWPERSWILEYSSRQNCEKKKITFSAARPWFLFRWTAFFVCHSYLFPFFAYCFFSLICRHAIYENRNIPPKFHCFGCCICAHYLLTLYYNFCWPLWGTELPNCFLLSIFFQWKLYKKAILRSGRWCFLQ